MQRLPGNRRQPLICTQKEISQPHNKNKRNKDSHREKQILLEMYEVVTLGGKHIIRLSACHYRRCHISQTKNKNEKNSQSLDAKKTKTTPPPPGPKKTKQQDLSLSCFSLHKKKTISILSSSLSPHQKKKKGETNPTRGGKKKEKTPPPPPPPRFFFLPNKQLATKPSHTFFLLHFPFFSSLSLLLLLSCCDSPLHLLPLLRHSLYNNLRQFPLLFFFVFVVFSCLQER